MVKHVPVGRQYEVDEHQPGCFWGMLHVLDYHHWQYVKKLLHNKKHHRRRRRIRCCATPKTTAFTHEAGKVPEHVDGGMEHLLGQHQIDEGKALVAENISNKESGKMRVLFPPLKLKNDHPVDGETSHTNTCSSKVEEELFKGSIRDPHFGEHDDFGKPRFTKARSFPLPDSSRARHYRTSTLKHKQSEAWFFPRGDKLKIDTAIRVDHRSLVPFNTTSKQETTVYSLDSAKTLDSHWWNHLIISQFKGIKRRIRRVLQESRKESLPSEVPVDNGSSDNVKAVSNDPVEESRLRRMKRLSSLNESLDKYARLFGESFSSESNASKLNNSRSVKLTAEEKVNAPKTFRRRLSLPDHGTFSSILGDLSYDNLHSGLSAWKKPESNKSKESELKSEPLHDPLKIDSLENSLEGSNANLFTEPRPGPDGGDSKDLYADGDICDENSVEFIRREHVIFHREGIATSSKSTTDAELSSQALVLQSVLPHNMTEGVDSRQCSSSSDENVLTRKESANNIFKPRLAITTEDECDFNFVKGILRLGGFFENEFIEPWESMDLPLDPKVFDELEASELHGLECSEGFCEHRLLFDLINETLIEIYERHFSYFPAAALSISQFVRPVTEGQHLLEEVWMRVKLYRGSGPELVPMLDDIVGRDMAGGDRWMDLRWEGECLALELEDMILDELVDELVHS